MKAMTIPKLDVILRLNGDTRSLNIKRHHIAREIVLFYLASNDIYPHEIEEHEIDCHASSASNTLVWINGAQERNQKFFSYVYKMMRLVIGAAKASRSA